ncbi:MAG TPA: hypothetical protein VIL71_17405 [Spirillospora sp.]
MIILSGVLVMVAIALLVAGIVAGNGESAEVFGLDALFVIYISIAVSIVSALCLAIGVFLRRKELFGPGVAPAAPPRRAAGSRKDRRKRPAPAEAAANAGPAATTAGPAATTAPATTVTAVDPADDAMETPPPPADVPEDALVYVVRGRKRYHLDTCRQLAGREREELTYAEAREEGFSSCTACMPDTALAARAAATVPASPGTGKAKDETKDREKDAARPAERGAGRPKDGLAGLAKPGPTPSPPSAAFDKTAEIPRTDSAADAPGREPARPAPGPAGPTLTDLPVGSAHRAGRPAEPTTREDPVVPAEPAPAEPEPAASAHADTASTEPPAATGSTASTDSRASDEPAAADSALAEKPDEEHEAAESDTSSTEAAPASSDGTAADADPAPGASQETVTLAEPGPASEVTAPKPRDADDEDDAAADAAPEPASSAGTDPAADADADTETGEGPQVRILSGTKPYHRTDCALIEDIGDEADDLETLSRAEAKARGCTPCLVCQPDREHARD